MKIFRLPDLGEGLPDAEIREWYIKEGDEVELDQPVVAMETAKALVDVPSPYTGKIVKLYGQAGDKINTDEPLIAYEGEPETPEEKETEDTGTVVGHIQSSDQLIDEPAAGIKVLKSFQSRSPVTPAVRALAKQLGVDLSNIKGSGKDGMITQQDVKAAVNETRLKNGEPLSAVRRAMVKSMSQSHAEVVHVTIVDDADLSAWQTKQDITLRIIRAIAKGCAEEPMLNAYFDGKNLSYQMNKTVNLGLAVDTEHGLYVPVLHDLDQLDDETLRTQINRYKQQAQERSFSPEELKNATIVLSNYGAIAGRYANPIVIPPMVAIVGIGKIREEVIAVDGKMEIHKILPISLSVDHRAITGGEAARFLAVMLRELGKP